MPRRQAGPNDRTQRPRTPGIVFSSIALVLLVLVGVFALTVKQPPPPSIAEFAPSVQERIAEPPSDQSSDYGQGKGDCVDPSRGCAGEATPPPPPEEVSRTRRCVGDRQTEDPQSPPCVPGWAGDNGGATSKGVTASEIKVASPGRYRDPRQLTALQVFFNTRFEFYGRRIRIIPFTSAGSYTTCANMKADAVKADEEIGAFASLSYDQQLGQESCYYDELARRRIISDQTSFVGAPATTEQELIRFGPYQWNYNPAVDTVLRNFGEVICNQLANRPPSFAGQPSQSAINRKFGLFWNTYDAGAGSVDPGPMFEHTDRCGVKWEVIRADVPSSTPAADVAQSAMVRMKDAGVTSVVTLGIYSIIRTLMQQATAQSYFPEWIVHNYQKQDDDTGGISYTSEHKGHVFGLRTWNKPLPRQEMPYWMAIQSVDAGYPAGANNYSVDYWEMLLVASGIQLAGPRLTPATFEAGLLKARFPNPGCGGPPWYQACVGFNDGTHSMIKDFALVWWSNTQRSNELSDYNTSADPVARQSGLGAFCYAEAGVRYSAGRWPVGAPALFTDSCD